MEDIEIDEVDPQSGTAASTNGDSPLTGRNCKDIERSSKPQVVFISRNKGKMELLLASQFFLY